MSNEDLAGSINMDRGLIAGLLEFDRDELTTLLAHIANEAKIPTAAFKKVRIELPSFSVDKWSEFASQFGLSPKIEFVKLETFTIPKYYLPPSLHEAMFKNAWRWQDVYREKVDQTREGVGMRILDPVCQPNSGYLHYLTVDDIVYRSNRGIVSRSSH
jgi:hypothetical protein